MKFSSSFIFSMPNQFGANRTTQLAFFNDTFKKINHGTDDDYIGTIVQQKNNVPYFYVFINCGKFTKRNKITIMYCYAHHHCFFFTLHWKDFGIGKGNNV